MCGHLKSLDHETLEPLATWLLPKKHSRGVGNMFIACGVLYKVSSSSRRRAEVDWAFNLFTRRASRLRVGWHNLHSKTTMVNYNPVDQGGHSS